MLHYLAFNSITDLSWIKVLNNFDTFSISIDEPTNLNKFSFSKLVFIPKYNNSQNRDLSNTMYFTNQEFPNTEYFAQNIIFNVNLELKP